MDITANLVNNFCHTNFDQRTSFTGGLIKQVVKADRTLLPFVTHCLMFRLNNYQNYSCNAFQFVKLTNGKYSVSERISKYHHEFTLCNNEEELRETVKAILVRKLQSSMIV